MTLNTEVAETQDTIGEFTSKCYGTRIEDGKRKVIKTNILNSLDVEYCVMDNLLDGFDAPAVMDIKVII